MFNFCIQAYFIYIIQVYLNSQIFQNIGSRPSIAKRKIQSKVSEQLGGRIDVICSRKAFSYVVNSGNILKLFCGSNIFN